jgi:hypothetical protein
VSAGGLKKRKLALSKQHNQLCKRAFRCCKPVTTFLLSSGSTGSFGLNARELLLRLHASQLSRTSCRTSVASLSNGSCCKVQQALADVWDSRSVWTQEGLFIAIATNCTVLQQLPAATPSAATRWRKSGICWFHKFVPICPLCYEVNIAPCSNTSKCCLTSQSYLGHITQH